MNRVEKITMEIENLMSDAEMDGYHHGYDEGYDEAVDKSAELIDEAYNDGFIDGDEAATSSVTVSYKGRTSDSYKFTTSDRNDPAIAELKASVSARNQSLRDTFARCAARGYPNGWAPVLEPYSETLMQPWNTPTYWQIKRVRLMPRGPRAAATVAEGSSFRRKYDSYLPMKYGTSFDVYVNRA